MILQVSVIGIIAVGVTQVIITGGIDLSSGSVVALTGLTA
jgi:inositol transport system permease protein